LAFFVEGSELRQLNKQRTTGGCERRLAYFRCPPGEARVEVPVRTRPDLVWVGLGQASGAFGGGCSLRWFGHFHVAVAEELVVGADSFRGGEFQEAS